MCTQSALSVLARVDQLIDSAKSAAQMRGKSEFWQRDKTFITTARECLLSGEPERVRWVLDQMRNLSQGFSSYCTDFSRLDGLLGALYDELAQVVST
jgi:hypothetical protein